MHLLAEASEELKYDLDLEGIARIWRGGCIIRAELLEQIRKAYSADTSLKNMMGSTQFSGSLAATRNSAVEVLRLSMERGVSTMCLSSALQYFDAFRTARLPLNMVQGQRDYFGSHTYERIDAEGTFHTEWGK
jgi:6-phosphogluconate dehydrogenase